jgi:RNA recognition motif-containing protein
MNIYVSNLGYGVQDEDLKGLFNSYGQVSSAKIILDKFTNQSRGFGFVEMMDDAEGQKAVTGLNGATMDGRSIKVSEARAIESRRKDFSSKRY